MTMRKALLAFLLCLVSVGVKAQKIVCHTTELAKFADCKVERTEYTNNDTTYTLYLHVEENKVPKSVKVIYGSRQKLLDVLSYLYHFTKGEGYYIDLESMNEASAISLSRGFYITAKDNVERVGVSRLVFGKLLNKLGVSVGTLVEDEASEGNAGHGDDMYHNSGKLF